MGSVGRNLPRRPKTTRENAATGGRTPGTVQNVAHFILSIAPGGGGEDLLQIGEEWGEAPLPKTLSMNSLNSLL